MAHTLALVPGLNNTHEVFADLAPYLDPSISVVTRNNDLLDRVEAIADAWLQVLPESFWLGGFSFGGYVSLAILERAPERVQGIALIASTPYADSPETRQRRLKALDNGEDQYASMLAAQVSRLFTAKSLANEGLVARRQAMALDYGFTRYTHHVQATANRSDRLQVLAHCNKPVWLIAAADDVVVPADTMRSCVPHIPGCQFHVVPESGHMLPLEQPEALAQLLNAWISGSFEH